MVSTDYIIVRFGYIFYVNTNHVLVFTTFIHESYYPEWITKTSFILTLTIARLW